VNKHFCPAPWLTLFTQPDGEVYSCCVGKTSLGNINDRTPEQIIHGPANLEIKRKMLAGESVEGCRPCHDKQASLQQDLLRMFGDIPNEFYQDINNFSLKYYDSRVSNTCNFACVYCGPIYSSVWAAELNQQHDIRIDKKEKSDVKNYLIDNVQHLEQVYLAGGEPLMMKENEQLLLAIKEQGKKIKKVLVNTNLSIIKNNKIFDLLTEIPATQWVVSMESCGQRYEYIRYPGEWETFKANLLHLKDICPVPNISFNMVLCALNGFELWDTIDWLMDLGFIPESISINLYNMGVVTLPSTLDIRVLSNGIRQKIIARAESDQRYRKFRGYNDVLKLLNQPRLGQEYITEFMRYLRWIDLKRGLDSRQIFPEVYADLESLTVDKPIKLD
jgi:MoaA/NifB/PqqE/SkfB family radical SAM enzyme